MDQGKAVEYDEPHLLLAQGDNSHLYTLMQAYNESEIEKLTNEAKQVCGLSPFEFS